MKYYIVNDTDRPYMRHVAVKRDGKFYYLHYSLRNFGPVGGLFATTLKDFGFEAEEIEGGVLFRKTRDSVAVYYDGSPRKWQGKTMFMLPYYKETKGEEKNE